MYSEQDLTDIKKQLKKIIILIGVITLLFIGISVTIANLVDNRLGMVVMVLGVCISIFIWGIYGASIYSYYVFLKDLIMGRSRNIQGIVRDISPQPIYKDNKLFYYEVMVEEDGVTRVLLLDDQKKWDPMSINRLYGFQIHENFIRGIMQKA